TGNQTLPMPKKLGMDIEADPEMRKVIDKVLPIRLQLIDFRDRPVFLIAFDAQESYDAIRERLPILGQELYPRLRAEPGSALVSENFAALYHVKIGDVLSVRGKNGPVELRVIGTVLDYTWNRGTILIDWPYYEAQFGESDADLFHV